MPEGDTLFKVARFIDKRASGHRITEARLLDDEAPWLCRRTVLTVYAHGKHVFFSLSPKGPEGLRLRVHLGMFGAWHHYPPGAPWQRPRHHARVVLTIEEAGQFVCFFAEDVELLSGSESGRAVRGRGPLGRQLTSLLAPAAAEPTARKSFVHPAASDDDMDAILRAVLALPAHTPAVDLLLNQRVAAGFGNVYKSELLFLFGLSPKATRAHFDAWQWASVFSRGRVLLQQNVGGWARTTTVDRRRMRLPFGLPRLWVYNRTTEPCLLCGTPIVRQLLGRHRRATFHCPTCQPEPSRPAASIDPVVLWRSYVHIPWQTRRARGPVRGR